AQPSAKKVRLLPLRRLPGLLKRTVIRCPPSEAKRSGAEMTRSTSTIAVLSAASPSMVAAFISTTLPTKMKAASPATFFASFVLLAMAIPDPCPTPYGCRRPTLSVLAAPPVGAASAEPLCQETPRMAGATRISARPWPISAGYARRRSSSPFAPRRDQHDYRDDAEDSGKAPLGLAATAIRIGVEQ